MRNAAIRIKGVGEATVSPLLFGTFVEFIENCIVGGVYEPHSPLSDNRGFRTDVLEKAKAWGPKLLRFPGGTVIGTYHWQDSIGPKHERRTHRNVVWGGYIDSGFGTAEFVQYCREIGAEPMICVNMPTGTEQEAADWVEYCNGTGDSYWANLRRSHGYPEPFAVKYWCIGNESYALPDLGRHHDVQRYITDAWEFVKYMKLVDPSIRIVLVGNLESMDWNKSVLDSMHAVCDFLSLHYYAGENGKGVYGPFVGAQECFQKVERVKALLDTYPPQPTDWNRWYRFPCRQGPITVAMDEWNIWMTPDGDAPQENPHGLQATYLWRDALWTAVFLNGMINRASYIGCANLAQMVNVIAPIMADAQGSWCQTTYHPLRHYTALASGKQLELEVNGPSLVQEICKDMPAICAAGVVKDDVFRLFVINLSDEPIQLRVGGARITSGYIQYADELLAHNDCNKESVQYVDAAMETDGSVRLLPHSISYLTATGDAGALL